MARDQVQLKWSQALISLRDTCLVVGETSLMRTSIPTAKECHGAFEVDGSLGNSSMLLQAFSGVTCKMSSDDVMGARLKTSLVVEATPTVVAPS